MDQELIDALTHRRIGIDEPNVAVSPRARASRSKSPTCGRSPSDLNEITLRAGFRARLVAPLMRGEDVVGLLVVRRRRLELSRKTPST